MASTPTSALRIGLIGAGMIGSVHAEAYRHIPGAKLAGVWDADLLRAEKAARPHGATAYARREDLLREVDAVDICLPTVFHLENIEAAARAGKAVICEKPLGRTVEQCDRAIAACRAAKVPLLVGHVLRFFPEYVALRANILNGSLGEPAVARLRRVVCPPGPVGSWYWDYGVSGGCVFDTGIHDLDWLLWTLGRPRTVYGVGHFIAPQLKDVALLTLTWSSGLLAHLEVSWCHDTFSTSYEVSGSEGLIECDLQDAVALRVVSTAGGATGGSAVPESPLAKSPYQAELEHFIEAIRGRAKPIVTPEEAREAVELANACLQAVKTREVVELPARKGSRKPKAGAKGGKRMPAAHPE
ncbi:MAG: Gfo/Idh/MocA family oxidoreductase [Planctomycetota bacterium]|nr:Gfo/Idh/MocA family oxidoreductase [Planctomycetota bacterium]